jgi:NAD(P)-dependent dehydrogenase (short-subunit alcohol dehydrogenase family)
MLGDLESTVVVTGAAGGIGSAICDLFLENGFLVVGMDLRGAAVSSPGYRHIQVDVTSESDMGSLAAGFDFTIQHLITCAGIAHPRESAAAIAGELIDASIFRASVELNLVSHYVTLMALLPNIEAATGDRSVSFTSSINALVGFANTLAGYSSAKAGLLGLVRTLVVPLGERGIRVNAVLPGTVQTPSTTEEWRDDPGHFERLQDTIPLRRLPTTRDIADVFFALSSLRHVTGQSIVVDGGQSVARNS